MPSLRRVELQPTRIGRQPTIVSPPLVDEMLEVWKDEPQAQLSDGEQYENRVQAQKVAGRYKSWLADKHDVKVSSLTGEDPDGGGFIFTLAPAEA